MGEKTLPKRAKEFSSIKIAGCEQWYFGYLQHFKKGDPFKRTSIVTVTILLTISKSRFSPAPLPYSKFTGFP